MERSLFTKAFRCCLDTIGELGRLYKQTDNIFVGGSLVKTGAIIFWNQLHMVSQFWLGLICLTLKENFHIAIEALRNA